MADFFLDADVNAVLAPILIGSGHTVLTTNQASRYNATDDEQFLVATDLDRLLVTHNRHDFELLSRAWRRFSERWGVDPDPHAGVIVLPQQHALPYPRAASEIGTLLHSHQDLRGCICEYTMKWGWQIQRF